MSLGDDLKQFLVGRFAFPAVNYALNRPGISGRYRKLLSTERLSQDELRTLQLQKLKALVERAYETVPFYRRRFQELGFVPADLRTLEDFQRIPRLDRQDVMRHRLDLVDFRLRNSALAADEAGKEAGLPAPFARFRRHRLLRNTTTGSTGAPTIFYEDGSTTALNWIHEQRLKSWFGIPPGSKEARMKGLSTAHGSKDTTRSIRELLWNQLMLPGFFLGDADHDASLQKIRRFKPRVLWGPTPAMTGLAQYVRRTGKDILECKPELAISWAAPLYDHEKKILGEVFGCPVANIYSTREVGHLAMTCPHGSMHVNQENYLIETEEASGPSRGLTGNILVTPLFDSPMPFLRYRIGDIVEMGSGACPCGRTLITLRQVLGRVGDTFETTDGQLVHPNFWCMAFLDGRPSRDVEKFQIVYRRADHICLRIVPTATFSPETEACLRQFLERHFPSQMQFEFEYVRDIPPDPSGKYRFVINEAAQPRNQLVASDVY